MILTFSGIDCAGKSTQIALLDNELRSSGYRTAVEWFRPGYSAPLDVARRVIRFIRPGALATVENQREREAAFAKPSVRRIWVGVALLDSLVQYAVKVRVLSLAGRIVLCDRYVEDALLDVRFRFPELEVDQGLAGRALRALSATPELAILFTLPREEMLKRMEKKREPFPDSAKIRDLRYGAYMRMASRERVVAVDASRTIEAVHEEVLARVRQIGVGCLAGS